jgi:hypothetical protein
MDARVPAMCIRDPSELPSALPTRLRQRAFHGEYTAVATINRMVAKAARGRVSRAWHEVMIMEGRGRGRGLGVWKKKYSYVPNPPSQSFSGTSYMLTKPVSQSFHSRARTDQVAASCTF